MTLKLGISSAIFHADPTRPVYKGKTLYYLEDSMSRCFYEEGVLPCLIPPPTGEVWQDENCLEQWIQDLDGLVLQGGVDVSPSQYGEEEIRPEWKGDAVRDQYELALFHAFFRRKKPVLGICRGAQVINVALGGTLYQDISLQRPNALLHRNWNIYDENAHRIQWTEGSWLAEIYPEGADGSQQVNSIHHQGVKVLGTGLKVEATCPEDGLIEAIRWEGDSFVLGVQWHPEFRHPLHLDSAPLFRAFIREVKQAKEKL